MPSHTVSNHLGLVVLKPFFTATSPTMTAATPALRRTTSVEDVHDETGKRSMDSLDSERSSTSTSLSPTGKTDTGLSTSATGGFWSRFAK